TPGGSTGAYTIQTAASSGVSTGLIDQDTAVASDHIIGTLTTPTITPVSLKAGATTNHTFSFTAISAIASGGKIEVDFNANYDLSGSLAYVSGNTGSTVAASNQTLTITLGTQISASAAPSIVISGIKNPTFLGTTGTYAVRTKNASSVLIDEGTGTANTIVVPTITLLTPSDTGITVYTGDSYNITWSSDGTVSNNLSLYYATDGSTYSNTIATGETNDATYSWTVPANPTTTAKVKIQDTFYQLLKDTTDTNFNAGTASSTTVSGTGNGASLVLTTNTTVTDNFTRADNNAAGLSWVESENADDIISIVSNQLKIKRAAGMAYWNQTTSNDQEASLTYEGGSSAGYNGPAVRVSGTKDSANGYGAFYAAGTVYLKKFVNQAISSGGSALGNFAQTLSAGDILKIKVTGSSITTYVNDVLKSTITDSSITSGYAGILIGDNLNDGAYYLWDDFIASDVQQGVYNSSGNFTSQSFDTTANNSFGTLSWTATTPYQTEQTSSSESGLVALWRMNEASGATTIADSVGAHTGTINGATPGVAGKFGNALSFSSGSSNYVSVAHNADLNPGTTYTLAAWVNPSSLPAYQAIITKDGYPDTMAYYLDLAGANVRFGYASGASGDAVTDTARTLTTGTWYYVAGTYDGTNVRIYVDGVSNSPTGKAWSSQATNTANLNIGKMRDSATEYFSGLIDEVAIYNRALSASELLAHYQASALKFQVAAKAADSGWLDSDFVGPANTTTDYFTASGTAIPSALNALRYIKYKAYLATTDTAYTPTLSDVSISFTSSTSGDRVVSAESANNFTMAGAQISAANIEPASLVVGATGNVTVSFTTVNAIPADGKIVVTFPAGFTLSSGASTAASSASGIDGTLTASVSGQVVTVTRSGGSSSAAGAKSFVLSNIKNPASTGSTGTYGLKTTTSADLTIDERTSITADTIATGGSLTLTNVEPATRYAGVTENVTINLTTANPLPSDAKIVITFPAGFTLSSGAATVVSSWNLTGTLSASVTGQVLTLTRSGATLQDAASTAVSIIVTNIQNPTP
ncbi:MAG: LamG domain-containing protein, partial [Dehalococcoidales bacterium]|nr:LamG domain-containing protein [Dehalococcoidales bacterium]